MLRNSIIVLLGAGASVDAGVPHSYGMIKNIEEKIIDDRDWQGDKDLYNYIRSSIYYAEGIRGKFDQNVQYNIETLVNTLDELAKKEEHPLYPFVGSWNPRLTEVLAKDFKNIGEFKNKIVKELIHEWVQLANYEDADYFQGLGSFQEQYQHSLRIFTLNYDLCFEKNCDKRIESGFDDATKGWDWRLFEESEYSEPPPIYYYKMHGSIDWERDQDTGNLMKRDRVTDRAELIFGTTYKLQYTDPFLFLAYEFRKWTLDDSLNVILTIGYGFGDEHINGIIRQSLKRKPNRILLSVSPLGLNKHQQDRENEIISILGMPNGCKQVKHLDFSASKFLQEELTLEKINQYLPEEEGVFDS